MAGITQYQPHGLPGTVRSFVAKAAAAGFVATFPASVLDQYRFPQIPYSFDAEHRAFLLDLQRCLSVPLTGDSFPGGIISPVDVTTRNNVKYYGAVGDGVTDDTVAITTALATGYNIYFPPGTYLTTGGHRISTTGQIVYGAGRRLTTIKKSTGTNYLIDTTHGVNFPQLLDMTFDGNSLGGSAVIWRAHYSTIRNVAFKNQGGTSYALFLSGVNLSHFENLMFWDDVYGGILADQSADTYSPQPSYSCLYSTFDNVSLGRTNGGRALKLGGSQSNILTFNNLYFEDTQAAVPAIDIGGAGSANCANITFNHLRSEPQTLSTHLINVATGYNIRFIGGRIAAGVSQTNFMFNLNNVDGFTLQDMAFYDNFSAAGRDIVQIDDVRNGRFVGNNFSFLNNFNFITSISINNRNIAIKNNMTRDYASHTGVGTNIWTGTVGLTIENDELTQNFDTATNVSVLDNLERGTVGTMTGHETFGPTDGRIFIKDPGGAARNFNPSGTFRALQKITLINTADAAETITFDSAGLNQAVAQNERGIFVYNGSAWLKIYVGS